MDFNRLQLGIVGERSRLEVIYQSEVAECGLACLAMVCAFYGRRYDIPTLRNMFSPSLSGFNLKELIGVADHLDLSARALKVPMDRLASLRTPAILHWDLQHFVVLEKLTRKFAMVIDPARGRIKLSPEEFSAHYTGIALELEPSEGFRQLDQSRELKFRHLWSRISGLRRSLTYIFITTIVLSFFTILTPQYIQSVVDDAIIGRDQNLLVVLALGFGFVMLFEVAVKSLRSFLVLILSNSLHVQIADNVFRHMMSLPMEYFERRHLGDIVSRFGSLEKLREIFTTTFVEALVDGFFIIVTLIILFLYSPLLAVVAVIASAMFFALRLILFSSMRRLTEQSIAERAEEQSIFMENVRGMQPIKMFGRESLRRASWQNKLIAVTNRNASLGRYSIGFQMGNGLIFGIENILIVYLAAKLVLSGQFTVGMLYAFVSYKGFFINSSQALIEKYFEFLVAKVHLARIADIVFTAPESLGLPGLLVKKANPEVLELNNIGYRYSPNSPYLYRQSSVKIPFGDKVAIVGPSGVGKTTLLKVMAGLLDPTEGEIFYGAQRIHGESKGRYRAAIAAVMQDDQLFAGSVFDNITFFDTEPNMTRMRECAKMACISEDIERMPMAYNTLVGDMGSALSGGQKQRIVLARALYHRPQILFLDEATSHLDTDNENRINQSLDSLAITRIVVAHRTSTIEHSDRFLTIINQRIVEISRDQALSLSQLRLDTH